MTRLGYAITTTAAVSLLGILSLVSFAPKLIWNASASTPIGLYAIAPDPSPEITDLVAVRAPEPLASFLAEGGYLPRGVPLLKHVVALPGQRVCRTGLAITVDAVPMAGSNRHPSRNWILKRVAGSIGLKSHLRWCFKQESEGSADTPRRHLPVETTRPIYTP